MPVLRHHKRCALSAVCVTGLLCLTVLTGCSERRGLERQADMFARWFVSPQAGLTDTLVREIATVKRLRDVAALAVTRGALPPGRDAVIMHEGNAGQWVLGYATPPLLDNSARHPLVIYLHGGVGGAAPDKGATAWNMLAPLIDSCGALLASPTADSRAPWWEPAGMERILMALRFMTLHFPVDPDRVILAGVSDGALGCYAAASWLAGPFAGFIAISGNGGVLASLGVTLVPGNMMQRPIYAVHAGNDRLFALEQTHAFLDQLLAQGVSVRRTIYPDEQHGFDYREQEMSALAQTVRTWRKPTGRATIAWRIPCGRPWRTDNLISVQCEEGTAGFPALNATLHKGRLSGRSIGLRSFVFLADGQPHTPVVVMNGQAEERGKDITDDVAAALSALQHSGVAHVSDAAIFAVTIRSE